ncbi:MAG: class I SAM-dependent methyltransferase [Candidatus Heimdallarchaeota archaeon]|nr:class I SAM-dependent methyltransferase [Candidatus Heimdallarchaeota archaeon]
MDDESSYSVSVVHEHTRDAYNKLASTYHKLFKNEMDEKPYDQAILDKFAEFLPSKARILDAGCGPSAQIGAYYLQNRQFEHHGVDISDECIRIATEYQPKIHLKRMDMMQMEYPDGFFDGIISFYSIIDTPKFAIPLIISEFHRVLKDRGMLIIVVKAGEEEGYIDKVLDIPVKLFFATFTEQELRGYLKEFEIEFLERRESYEFEISNDRIYCIARKG